MDALTIALVGGLAGGTIAAIVAGLVTLIAQSREHKHERTLAKEERRQDRRAVAYERILEYVYHLSAWVDRTEPVIGPGPEPPARPTDAEVFKLNALVAIHASPDVRDLMLRVSDAARTFEGSVWLLQAERAGESDGKVGAWRSVEDARRSFREAVRALGNRMAEELYGED